MNSRGDPYELMKHGPKDGGKPVTNSESGNQIRMYSLKFCSFKSVYVHTLM